MIWELQKDYSLESFNSTKAQVKVWLMEMWPTPCRKKIRLFLPTFTKVLTNQYVYMLTKD